MSLWVIGWVWRKANKSKYIRHMRNKLKIRGSSVVKRRPCFWILSKKHIILNFYYETWHILSVSLSYHTKYHRQGNLNKIDLCLTVLEAGMSKVKVLAKERPLLLVCGHPPSYSALCMHLEKELCGVTYKNTNPVDQCLPPPPRLWPHLI